MVAICGESSARVEKFRQDNGLATNYIAYLDRKMDQQAPAVTGICKLLEATLERVLPRTGSMWRLGFFGSRWYGASLPSSDIDLVLELAESIPIKPDTILVEVSKELRNNASVTRLQNVIGRKRTITFRCASLMVDFTAGYRWKVALSTDRPSFLSLCANCSRTCQPPDARWCAWSWTA